MEKRQVTQVKVYKLLLNPMNGKGEQADLVAFGPSRQALEEWMNAMKCNEDYKDGRFWKRFSKDSILEMYNPWIDQKRFGIFEEWANEEDFKLFCKQNINKFVLPVGNIAPHD